MSPALTVQVPALSGRIVAGPVAGTSIVAPGVCGMGVAGIVILKGNVFLAPVATAVPLTLVPSVASQARLGVRRGGRHRRAGVA